MIKEINAYEINNKLFHSLGEAETYKKQRIDDVKLGDSVEATGFLGRSGRIGTVCCIEGNKIYFAIGNIPEEYVKTGKLTRGGYNISHNGQLFNWEIGCLTRDKLIKYT